MKYAVSYMDKLELAKNIAEHKMNIVCTSQAATKKEKTEARLKFMRAYLKFADIATRACEQGIL